MPHAAKAAIKARKMTTSISISSAEQSADNEAYYAANEQGENTPKAVRVVGEEDRRVCDHTSCGKIVSEPTARLSLLSRWSHKSAAKCRQEAACDPEPHNKPLSADDTVRVPATMK